MPEIAVVGGGIAGASIAYHLARRGDRSVTVYERGGLAGETTAKSVAIFGHYGSPTERRMKRYAMALYNRFLSEPRAAPGYELLGRLVVATSGAGAAALDDRVAADPGPDPVAYLSGRELSGAVVHPELDTDALEGGLYRPNVGSLLAVELTREFVERARDRGVAFETGVAVESIAVSDGRATGVAIDGDTVPAEAVVCAAGPWNPTVARTAGLDLPVAHTLAPVLSLQTSARLGRVLPFVQHHESGVYAVGHDRRTVRVGGYPERRREYDPDDVSDEIPAHLRERMMGFVDRLFPGLATAEPTREWVGIRSHTPDGNPITGWTGVEGLSIAAFDSSGIQLAPAVGDVIARQLLDGEPTDYHDALSISRFDGHDEVPFSLAP